MKKKVNSLLIISLLLLNVQAFSQTTSSPYQVATWAGFRSAAVCYTFDDGCPNQFKVAIPLFDKYGFKLTLFTVPGWITDWTALKQAAANGHEVASHSFTHPNLANIDVVQQELELKKTKDTIEKYTNKKCLTVAYPYCVHGSDSICSMYYISARACQGFIEPKTPSSYLNISSLPCGNLGAINAVSAFETSFEQAEKTNGWCIFLLHGVDDDGGYSPIASVELAKSLEYLNVRKNKFWVTTFLDATLYSKERDAVVLNEISATKSAIKLTISDNLPDSIYNFPLTVRRPLPKGWKSATVTQNNKAVSTRMMLINSTLYVVFDAVPDAGEIKIAKSSKPVIPEVEVL